MLKLFIIVFALIWSVELGSWIAGTCGGGSYGIAVGGAIIALCLGSIYFFYRRF